MDVAFDGSLLIDAAGGTRYVDVDAVDCEAGFIGCAGPTLGISITDRCGEAVGLEPGELLAVSVGVTDDAWTGEDVNVRDGGPGGDPTSSRKNTPSLVWEDMVD
jgi:hypothetical protein